MATYTYICHVKWHDKAKEKGRGYFTEVWLPNHDKVCDRHGFKLLQWGLPMGTREDHTFIWTSEHPPDQFMEFKGDINTINGERLWDYSVTTTLITLD
jgi:hypothetical protein